MTCSFCDNTDYGGTFTFEGDGIVEQPIAVDMCLYHWPLFWRDITKAGWIPNSDDKVRLVNVVEEPVLIDYWRLKKLEEGLDKDSEE